MKNVVFLDYDDVVNTPMWKSDGKDWFCKYNFPEDNCVNNEQAVQWVSAFCEKYGYSIVVSSTWRYFDNYKECLLNGGLRPGIKIDGCTPILDSDRDTEICEYLKANPDITGYLIFDDIPKSFFKHHRGRVVHCGGHSGFGESEYYLACELHHKYNSKEAQKS